MDDFLKMDVFFVVATVSTVLLSALVAIILWRLSRILASVERITEQVALESEEIRKDLGELRRDIRAGKGKIRAFTTFIQGLTKKKKKDA